MSRLDITEGVHQTGVPHITTIHSLALSYIRRSPSGFGLRGKVTPLDDYEQQQMLRKLIERRAAETNSKAFADMNDWLLAEKIGFHRARGLGFQSEYTPEYHQVALGRHGGYHAMSEEELDIWYQFESEKKCMRVVDFDDMIHLCVRRGNQDAAWVEWVGSLYYHVLMDEGQDTNVPQWKLVNMHVAPENKNFYVVGDLAQSVYSFNGAQPKLLKDYSEGWRGQVPTLYRLQRNHRSVPEVVALANAVNKKMTEVIPIQMDSHRGSEGEHGRTKLIQAQLPTDIAEIISREIWLGANRDQPPIPYRGNAILVRSGSQIRDIEGELVKLRIPYIVRGGRGLLGTEEVRDVLAFLRLATNPNDFTAFARAVSVPRRGIGKAKMEALRFAAAEAYGGDLVEACRAMPALDGFAAAVKEIQAHVDDASAALASVFDAIGYIPYLRQKYGSDPNRVKSKVENLGRLATMVKGLGDTGCMSTEDVVFRLTMEKAAEDDPKGQVTISTIHAAKGLEWQRVYVFSVIEGYLPHKWARTESECEEERRLWYVAITRAKDVLAVCVPGMIQYPNSGPRKCQPSRFLFEVGIMKQRDPA